MRFSIDGFDFEGSVEEFQAVLEVLATDFDADGNHVGDPSPCENCGWRDALNRTEDDVELCDDCFMEEAYNACSMNECDCEDNDYPESYDRCDIDDGEGACSFTPDEEETKPFPLDPHPFTVSIPSVWANVKDVCYHDYEYGTSIPSCKKCRLITSTASFSSMTSGSFRNPAITTTTVNVPTVCQHRYVYDKDSAMFECFNGCGSTIQ